MTLVQLPETHFAVNRIDRLTGRVFTVASLLTFGETIWNAVPQFSRLNLFWAIAALSVLGLAHIANLLNFWLFRAKRFFYLFHGLAYVLAFSSWSLQVGAFSSVAQGSKPWLWWATGSAAMAVGMYAPRWWAIGYMLFVPVSWAWLHALPIGGAGNLEACLTDAFYTALFPATITALVLMLRQAALRVDQAGEIALNTEMVNVSRETAMREKVRVDAAIYAGVFEALKAVAKAKNSSDYSAAVALSEHALERIKRLEFAESGEISTLALFDTLEVLSRRVDPDCDIAVSGSSLTFIPSDVANAISDAVLQAMMNSIQHAGAVAKRKLRLKGTRDGIKVVVQDDGVGFWPSKIPSTSRGFRYLILKRVTEAGGSVHVDAAPGRGTSIVIEWEAK